MWEIILDPYNIPFWIILVVLPIMVLFVASRPFLTYIKFVYPNAKFEAIGNPYINDFDLAKLLDGKKLSDFIETINSNRDYQITGDDSYKVQVSLDENLFNSINMMKNDSSKKLNKFLDLFIEKLDIYLVKNAIKNKIEGNKIDSDIFERAILDKNKKLIEKLVDSEINSYPEIFESFGYDNDIIELLAIENIQPIDVDNAFDKYIINQFLNVRLPYKCDKARLKYFRTFIDIQNIKNVLRAKKYTLQEHPFEKLFIGTGQELAKWKLKELYEQESVDQIISSLEGTSYYDPLKDSIEQYNKEDSIQIFENVLDYILLKTVINISTENYINIGPTLRYIVTKEYEIKNLKAIAKGISENIPRDLIKKYLLVERGL